MPFRLCLALPLLLGVAAGSAAPEPFDAIAARAAAAREGNRVEEAIGLYRKGLALRPNWPEGWWRLGTLYYDTERFAQAAAAFGKFVQADPKAGPGFAMLGLSEFQLKHHELALAALVKSGKLGPGKNEDLIRAVRYHIAILNTRLGMPEVGLSMLDLLAPEITYRGAPEAPAMLDAFGLAGLRRHLLPSEIPEDKRDLIRTAGRARARVAMGDRAEAGKAFDALLARYPEEPGVHYLYGCFLLWDDSRRALAEFERELKISPRDEAARLQIAFECLRTADYERGVRYAEEAVKLAPGNFAAHTVLGRLLMNLERMDQALAELETAVKLAPDSPDARLALSQAYTQVGRRVDAERERAEFQRLQSLRK